jgi:DhnA family fructose-bisphosphate aldolase class Ia
MTGAELRARRLFDRNSGRAYVVAIDHGLLFGVQPGNEDATIAVRRSLATEPDGVLISPGMLARTGADFGHRGAASPIVRLDWLTLADPVADYGDNYRMVCSPRRAAALGADAVCVYLVFGAETAETFADNVAAVARAVDEAHEVGLPLVVEVTAWGSQAKDRRDPEVLSFGSRVAAEIGADLIKTEYTGDPESMAKLVAGCPVPVLVLGGAKTESSDALLQTTRDALSANVAGVIYGRNIWQADDPAAVGAGIRALVHGTATAQ